jgi:hypothetical protein
MDSFSRSGLYTEEFKFIFDKKGSNVRRATVISALIEWQVFSLASKYLNKRGVEHKPEQNQEYNQSFNVLKTNRVIEPDKLDMIKKFRIERNKSIHDIFKGITRPEWDKQNKLVINLGKKIVEELDKELFPKT